MAGSLDHMPIASGATQDLVQIQQGNIPVRLYVCVYVASISRVHFSCRFSCSQAACTLSGTPCACRSTSGTVCRYNSGLVSLASWQCQSLRCTRITESVGKYYSWRPVRDFTASITTARQQLFDFVHSHTAATTYHRENNQHMSCHVSTS